MVGHADTPDEALAAGLAAVATALLALLVLLSLGCCCRRPRLALAVASLWLVWLGCKFAQGKRAWDEVLQHADGAAEATAAAAVAVWAMLRAWFQLMLPLLVDLWHLLEPLLAVAATEVAHAWAGLSVREKSMLSLFALGLCGTALALVAVWRSLAAAWRSREAVKGVLFQLSFAGLGPLIWWLSTRMPPVCTNATLEVFMSVLPVFGSFRALLKLREERRKLEEASGAPRSWFSALAQELLQQPQGQPRTVGDLEERARLWLSYWSCWPLLMFLRMLAGLLVSEQVLSDQHVPAINGVILCLVVWAQFWNASLCAPILFMICGRCLGGLAEWTSGAANTAVSWVATQRWRLGVLQRVLSKKWALLAAGAVVILGLAQLFQEVSEIVTYACVAGVGVDSARCVARNDSELYAQRLSFWVLAMLWQWLLLVPLVGSLISVATPLVLVSAFVGGQTVFHAAAGLMEKRRAKRQPHATGQDQPLLSADAADAGGADGGGAA